MLPSQVEAELHRARVVRELKLSIIRLVGEHVGYKYTLQVMGALCITIDDEEQDLVVQLNTKMKKAGILDPEVRSQTAATHQTSGIVEMQPQRTSGQVPLIGGMPQTQAPQQIGVIGGMPPPRAPVQTRNIGGMPQAQVPPQLGVIGGMPTLRATGQVRLIGGMPPPPAPQQVPVIDDNTITTRPPQPEHEVINIEPIQYQQMYAGNAEHNDMNGNLMKAEQVLDQQVLDEQVLDIPSGDSIDKIQGEVGVLTSNPQIVQSMGAALEQQPLSNPQIKIE